MTQGQFQEELLRAPGEGAWLFVAIKARWEHLLLNYYNASSSAAPVQLFLRKLTQCSLYVAVSHGTRIPTWKILEGRSRHLARATHLPYLDSSHLRPSAPRISWFHDSSFPPACG